MSYRSGTANGYPIVDADTHVNEPPDLWEKRLPRNLRDRTPRLVDKEGRQAWIFGDRPLSISRLVNAAGISPVEWTMLPEGGLRAMRPGAWDPVERLKDMDIDMVDVHVLYPTYAIVGAYVLRKDRELHNAVIRAYNDWVSDFCSHAPNRLAAVALTPLTGVDDAIDEVKRARGLPGISAAMLFTWPNGSKHPIGAEDDRFWSALEDLDLPGLSHVGFNVGGEQIEADHDPIKALSPSVAFIAQEKLAVDTLAVGAHLILDGILERHPRMRWGFIESGIGWIPFFLEQIDDNYYRHRFWTKAHLSMPPSEYFRRQCSATFQIDHFGIRSRHEIGIANILWSSDYPHAGANWPDSRERIAAHMHGVPEDERRLILSENAVRFYSLKPRPAPITR